MENGQYAFRVKPTKHLLAQPAQGSSGNRFTQVIHSRKAHQKSRGGCYECKQRRKKCDEARPSCTRCLEKHTECKYIAVGRPVHLSNQAKESTPRISTLLWPVARSPPVLTASDHAQHTPKDLLLLDYFINNVGVSVAGPEYSHTFTVQVIDIAKEVPFLMHAMLALSACQLQHTVADGSPYRLPEALHTHLASQGLRQAVGHMNTVKDMDSVLTSAMLLNCLAFCYADWRDEEVDVNTSRPSWNWLRIQTGLKDLLIETKPFHCESIWMPMFIATKTFAITEPPQNDLDIRLAKFCGIVSDSSDIDNPYFEFYTQLAPLVIRKPDIYYLRMYSNAIGGIDQKFVELLEKEDSKAMVLFAHWLALMCSCITWWITRRTSRECWMICRILDKRLLGEDRALLERPAEACGYPLGLGELLCQAPTFSRTMMLGNNFRALA
ncbi:hypothetical protein BKA66DRAFT_435315 [Pyrenochaeta sp. MPI-SDFR-AT-0127]|nr:hypothetical protein BKA66DRAFT_435315 [Pyrenochaeta sp. MPI-SDFR-AT-0127]